MLYIYICGTFQHLTSPGTELDSRQFLDSNKSSESNDYPEAADKIFCMHIDINSI